MKYSFLLVMSLCAAGITRAQDYKVAVENTKDAKLILDGFTEDLPIEGYNGNEIIVSSDAHKNEERQGNDRTKGLKAIYAAGTDNTGIAVSMEKNGNRVTLRCLLPITQSAHYKLRVPENIALEITRDCARGGETNISNMKNEVEFKGCNDITLKNVTGPLVINTISGNVNAVFTELAKDKPVAISCISGELDVTLPAKTPFTVEMSNISGNMYSDFDFPSGNKDMQRVGGGKIHSDINGGGTEVKLHNISGNIYLRKG